MPLGRPGRPYRRQCVRSPSAPSSLNVTAGRGHDAAAAPSCTQRPGPHRPAHRDVPGARSPAGARLSRSPALEHRPHPGIPAGLPFTQRRGPRSCPPPGAAVPRTGRQRDTAIHEDPVRGRSGCSPQARRRINIQFGWVARRARNREARQPAARRALDDCALPSKTWAVNCGWCWPPTSPSTWPPGAACPASTAATTSRTPSRARCATGC